MKRKVAIVGKASSTIGKVSEVMRDPNFEVWGLNDLYLFHPHILKFASRWFSVQSQDRIKAGNPEMVNIISNMTIPVYRPDNYPMREICGHFKKPDTFFNSSIALMVALAVYEGFKQINLYGVELGTIAGREDEQATLMAEFYEQRPFAMFLLGWAEAKGITIRTARGSTLLTDGMKCYLGS